MRVSMQMFDRLIKTLGLFLLSLAFPAALLCFYGFAVYLDPVLLLSAIGCTAICYVVLRDLRATRA